MNELQAQLILIHVPENFLLPPETIKALATVGENKARLPILKMTILGVLAGAYIGFGAHLATTATTGISALVGFGITRIISGTAFSLGLILVIIAGAELFTGNTLMVIALLDKRITFLQLLRNWSLVYLTNFIGAVLVAAMIFFSGLNGHGDALTPIGQNAVSMAVTKSSLPMMQIVIRGILANWLVCLAVVLAYAAKDIVSKIVAILVPVMAFVAMGFEHSIANMYFIPAGIFAASGSAPSLTWSAALLNIFYSTGGNIIGGVVFVAGFYWLAFVKSDQN